MFGIMVEQNSSAQYALIHRNWLIIGCSAGQGLITAFNIFEHSTVRRHFRNNPMPIPTTQTCDTNLIFHITTNTLLPTCYEYLVGRLILYLTIIYLQFINL